MRAESGFTLIEVLVASACTTILFLGLLSASSSLFDWMRRLDAVLTRDENIDMVPLMLVPLLSHAGNRPQGLPGPPLELLEGELVVRSDIAGPGNRPDGRLEAPFELLSLRAEGARLRLKSGRGSYQPLVNEVASAAWSLDEKTQLVLKLDAMPSGPGAGALSRRRLELVVPLPNLLPTLFPIQ